jgi:hypothetical protein
VFLGLAVLIALGGCAAAVAVDQAAQKILVPDKVNFREKNFATADYLLGQARGFVKPQDLIVAEPLMDRKQPGMESDMATLIPEQIGVRMSQLGYRIDLQNVVPAQNANYLKPAREALSASPKFTLSGNFLRQRRAVDVNVRLVEIASGRVVAAFDYMLPLTREVRELSAPEPQIIRMTPQQ